MKLLIDIGNTNTSIATAEKTIYRKYFIRTDRKEIDPGSLKRLLGRDLGRISRIILVSVVPRFSSVVAESIRSVLPAAPLFRIGKDIKVPMKVKYRRPRDVGQDRLVLSFAAARLWGCPVLVVDFGTAVTFDFVNGKGEYEGGLIFPGLRLALRSLVSNTALLPEIELKKRGRGLIGRNTPGSMNKGILFGYAGMCDGIIGRFKEKYGRRLKVVSTGGDASLVAKYSRSIKEVSPDMIFTGLNLLSD